MEILHASATACGPFFIIFIIIVVVIINVVTNMQKMNKSGGGSILGDFNEALKQMGDTTTGQAGHSRRQGGSQYHPGAATILHKKKRPPINWNLIRLNLTPERIRECFDMDALRAGVKKEDLPKYVYLDKLRNYYTEPQLRDMLDLDFFEEGEKKFQEFVPRSQTAGSLSSTLKQEKVKPVPSPKLPQRVPKSRYVIDREVVKEKALFESAYETGVLESTSDSFAREKAADLLEKEKVSESMFMGDAFDYGTAVSDYTTAPVFSGEEIRKAMIWKEILSEPPAIRAYKRYISAGRER